MEAFLLGHSTGTCALPSSEAYAIFDSARGSCKHDTRVCVSAFLSRVSERGWYVLTSDPMSVSPARNAMGLVVNFATPLLLRSTTAFGFHK